MSSKVHDKSARTLFLFDDDNLLNQRTKKRSKSIHLNSDQKQPIKKRAFSVGSNITLIQTCTSEPEEDDDIPLAIVSEISSELYHIEMSDIDQLVKKMENDTLDEIDEEIIDCSPWDIRSDFDIKEQSKLEQNTSQPKSQNVNKFNHIFESICTLANDPKMELKLLLSKLKCLENTLKFTTLEEYKIKSLDKIFKCNGIEKILTKLNFKHDYIRNTWICDLCGNENLAKDIELCIGLCNHYIKSLKQNKLNIKHTKTISLNLSKTASFDISKSPKTSPSEAGSSLNTFDFSLYNLGSSTTKSGNTFLEPSYSTTDGIHLKELIASITSPFQNVSQTNELIDAILLTFPSFTCPIELLKTLENRFFNDIKESKADTRMSISYYPEIDYEETTDINTDIYSQTKVMHILKTWIKRYWLEDFHDNIQMQKQVQMFLDQIKTTYEASNLPENEIKKRISLIKNIENCVALQIKHHNTHHTRKDSLAIIKPQRNFKKFNNIKFKEFDNAQIAQQLTLMDFSMFSLIRKRECMNENWKKKKHDRRLRLAPNITSLINSFNDTVKWVQMTILAENKPKHRGYLIKKFIKIIILLHEYRNFHTFFAILSSLDSTSIARMEKSWKHVPKKYVEKFQKLKVLISSKKSYSNIRIKQKKSSFPQIPYFGVFCADLVAMNQIPKRKKDNSLNLNSLVKTLQIVNRQLIFQNTPYHDFKPNIDIQQYLINEFHLVHKVKSDSFYVCSINLEPKKKKKKKKKKNIR